MTSIIRFTLVVVLATFAITAEAQNWRTMIDDPQYSFEEVKTAFYQEFGDETGAKSSGWKQFKRWEWFQEQDPDEGGGNVFGGNDRSMALMGIIGSLAMRDVDSAFDRLGSIENPQERQMAMQGLGHGHPREQRFAHLDTGDFDADSHTPFYHPATICWPRSP
mgnify:CR=1 FL=1